MNKKKRFDVVRKRLVPPAVVPLIEVYTGRSRHWNGNHRKTAQKQLLEAASRSASMDDLEDWILTQRHSGILVEAWFAFRCFDLRGLEALPDEEMMIARVVIEQYVLSFWRDFPSVASTASLE